MRRIRRKRHWPNRGKAIGRTAGPAAVYGLGLGLPFIAATAIGPFMRASDAIKKRFGAIEKTVGALLVGTIVLFVTGGFQSMSLWLIETFPRFGQVG